jgi:hypothetical protein
MEAAPVVPEANANAEEAGIDGEENAEEVAGGVEELVPVNDRAAAAIDEAREALAVLVEAEGNEAAEPADAEDNADAARDVGAPIRGDKRHWRRGYRGLWLEVLNEMARQNGYSESDRPVLLSRLRKKDKVVVFTLIDKDIETCCWASMALNEQYRSPDELLAGQENWIKAYLWAHDEEAGQLVPAGELAKLLIQLR